ncbi:MAG: hypothetical protein BMS9Abin08_0230 [Gammaproteobacteria bacterium]|nr:MAG: hypothetical protein BMS9Abin08_0230 [Gammaproteobacteria bacterium]
MNSSGRLHVRMGCGEPLQSRSWIPRPVKALSVSGHDGKPKCARARTANVRGGDKCRS